MAISFVESTLKSTTWGVRIDTDLIFLSTGNVSVQNLPSDTILSMINPRLRSTNALISYSVWDFIFSKKITEAQFNNLLIMFRGILKIQLSTNPETLEVSDFVITGLPGGVTLTTVQKMSTTGVTSLWQLGFSRILTQSELDGLGIQVSSVVLPSNQILRDQPQTVSITYLRIRLNSNIPSLTSSNLNIQGLPASVVLVSISKESSGTGYSIWDIRFSRNLTADETRRLVITITGALDSNGRLLNIQPLTDTINYINPLTRLPATTQSFFDGIRYLISVSLEEPDLSDEIIANDVY